MKDDPQGLASRQPSSPVHTYTCEVSSDSNLVLRNPKLVYNFVVKQNNRIQIQLQQAEGKCKQARK